MTLDAESPLVAALTAVWRALRNDASVHPMATAVSIALFACDAGLIDRDGAELWIRRFQTCPGHDDEGGRAWCAYCGDLDPCADCEETCEGCDHDHR